MHTHTLIVDLSQATQGENTYTCTVCKVPVILIWNGYTDADGFHASNWGPRHEDGSDPAIVEAQITYV